MANQTTFKSPFFWGGGSLMKAGTVQDIRFCVQCQISQCKLQTASSTTFFSNTEMKPRQLGASEHVCAFNMRCL